MKSKLEEGLLKTLSEYEAEGLRRTVRPIERLSARECRMAGKTCLDFSSNDYLGLSFNQSLKEESIRWTGKFGCGSGASRLISGTSPECLALEERIAQWKGFEAAMVLGSGYAANIGLIQALASKGDVIFADKLNHASLNAGCLLAQAEFKRYKHNDLAHLARLLASPGLPERRLAVTDSVFSMDGDIAPLDALRETAASAFLYIDDAHASGVLGSHGHGLASQSNCDMALSTFSKALGSYGACAACSKDVKEFLISKCGPFIYSTALPPSVLGSISAAVDFVQTAEADALRAKLESNSLRLKKGIKDLGLDCGCSATMIVPLIVGTSERCLALSSWLLEKGIFAPGVRPPTVPKGTARLRLSVNAGHEAEDIDRLLDALKSFQSARQ